MAAGGDSRDVIHPAVAALPPMSSDARRALRAAEGAGDDTTVILMAARLEEWKGHRVLLEAAATLTGRVAIWMAAGPQRPHEIVYLESLTRFAAERLPPGRVRFLGERSDVPQLMHAADVDRQPDTSPEPFGIVFVEALAAGTLVVTTAMGGAVEIVDERCGILVAEPSSGAVAAALQRLVDDPSLRTSLGRDGPARASRISDPARRLREVDDAVRRLRERSSAA